MSDFDKSVCEEIKEHTWVCDTHGTLTHKELTISIGGHLMCGMCEAATIGRPNDDIDTSVIMLEFADDKHKVINTNSTDDDIVEIENTGTEDDN